MGAQQNATTTVVIVPCTREKIWDDGFRRGKVPARDAYTSQDFRRWRQRAESSGHRWLILSTEYGMVELDRAIGPYEATVTDGLNDPAFHALLRRQGREFGLAAFDQVVLLNKRQGSRAFQKLVRIAVNNSKTTCLRKIV